MADLLRALVGRRVFLSGAAVLAALAAEPAWAHHKPGHPRGPTPTTTTTLPTAEGVDIYRDTYGDVYGGAA